ncbi:hypothetical protein DFP72DRAFT_461556 [Ephemerocybe angulata]|uniref:Nephrocystin 3-like N-terminal domain-containing protein n=1 Tax=Ephemerocybe angulata TaxID=980116 RepID=A0A8H6HSS3_9AGAR|nr:hypothetical protein DFP72DRAFT_461556 [Tulosesus angulatus]
MSRLFEGAHHINSVEVNITEVRGNYYESPPASDGALQLLQPHIAAGALHNSEDRCDAPKCHPETRTAVQENILGWAVHDAGSEGGSVKNVMWITGPAGTGKTAIAGSIAETCKERGILAGAFFFSSFSGDARRRSKRYLVPTLAYQLVRLECFRDVSREVELAIRQDPAIFEQRLEDQLETLILRPLRAWRHSVETPVPDPMVIIIDGLDECQAPRPETEGRAVPRRDEDEQLEILEALQQLVIHAAFPLRILLLSRPEPVIRRFFAHTIGFYHEIFLDDKYDPDSDIALFLRAKFAEIRLRNPAIPTSWPSEDVIRLLVKMASGQFIYVATVIRFVDGPSRNPQLLLKQVLETGMRSDPDSPNPLAPLDLLYTAIMNRSPDPRLLATWLAIIEADLEEGPYTSVSFIGWSVDVSPRSAFFWRALLCSYPGEADSLLENVSSLMAIPPRDDFNTEFHFYHRSFGEFLNSPRRCTSLYISNKMRDSLLQVRAVQVLKGNGPAFSLAATEEAVVFYTRFLQVFVARKVFCDAFVIPSLKADFLACDSSWWMQKLSEVPGVTYLGQNMTSGFLYPWLDSMHIYCNLFFCHSVCKHWRRGAERFARDNGRFVPGPLWLIHACVVRNHREILARMGRKDAYYRPWPSGLAIPYAKFGEDAESSPRSSRA